MGSARTASAPALRTRRGPARLSGRRKKSGHALRRRCRSDVWRPPRRSPCGPPRSAPYTRGTSPAGGRRWTSEEVAVWAAALCSPYAGYITGETLTIDGGHWLEQESYLPALGKQP